MVNALDVNMLLFQKRGSRDFSRSANSSDYQHLPAVLRERHEAFSQIYNIDAIRSVRRKRKPLLDNSILREYAELQKLQVHSWYSHIFNFVKLLNNIIIKNISHLVECYSLSVFKYLDNLTSGSSVLFHRLLLGLGLLRSVC